MEAEKELEICGLSPSRRPPQRKISRIISLHPRLLLLLLLLSSSIFERKRNQPKGKECETKRNQPKGKECDGEKNVVVLLMYRRRRNSNDIFLRENDAQKFQLSLGLGVSHRFPRLGAAIPTPDPAPPAADITRTISTTMCRKITPFSSFVIRSGC